MSKIFRMRPERSSPPSLDWVMKEQPQFVIRVLNARLSDPTPTSEQYGREAARVKALRPLCGAENAALTQAFLPARHSAMWGMRRCVANSDPSMSETQTKTPEVVVEAEMGSPFRLRCMRRNG
jgi:hypothetical protein